MVSKIRNRIDDAREALRPRQVARKLDRLTIKSGSDPMTSSDFLYELTGARKAGFDEIEVDVSKLQKVGVFPNVAVPLSALMELSREKVDFVPVGLNGFLEHLGLFSPYEVGSQLAHQHNVLNKVWVFKTSEDTFRLTREFMDELYKTTVIKTEGVLNALEWCLGEVLENAVLHSESPRAYVMGQIHTSTHQVAFSVVDLGQGIYNSLTGSGNYHPRTPIDAITLAIREGVTRNTETNQGNGLWGLHNIVRSNKGLLTIVSGGRGLRMHARQSHTFKARRYGLQGGGTLIDFRFDLTSPVSFESALGGYVPKPMAILSSADQTGDIHYSLKEQKSGFGTREAGIRIRNEILNLQSQTGGKVVIDFDDIAVITSSFADELIGKLYADMGPINFGTVIQLLNMSDAVRVVVDRAIVQRLSSQFKS